MFLYRSDYIFTLFLEGLGASTHLSVLPFGIVVEPSSCEARMLIVGSHHSYYEFPAILLVTTIDYSIATQLFRWYVGDCWGYIFRNSDHVVCDEGTHNLL